jgi:hypothetical protein
MQRQKSATLVQIGVGLIAIGLAVKLALIVGMVLSPLAMWAIIIGAIVLIIGLVSPGR